VTGPTASVTHLAQVRRNRLQTRTATMTLDAALCSASVMAAYLIRFEGHIPDIFWRQMLFVIPALVIARLASNWAFGVYRFVWRYISLHEALRLAQSVMAISAVLLICRLTLVPYSDLLLFPLSIIVIEGAGSMMAMIGSRFLPRILRERGRADGGAPTILAGAGQGGVAVAKEAMRHPDLGLRPVGFLDDDRAKAGMAINSLPVLGTLNDASRVIEKTGATQVLITSTEIPPKKIVKLIDACRPLGVDVRIVPGLYENLDSKNPASGLPLREVRIEDLLSRDPVPPSLSLADLRTFYGGKRILVTGAGGSIGGELVRQLRLMDPATLILAERDETNLFEIDRELAQAHGRVGDIVVPLLIDIMNGKDLERAFKELQPQVVFHAAAFKHVPMMERQPWDAVRNNVFGTRGLAELADQSGVESFVMISTDKAVNPTSVMGASKRLAEQVVQEIAPRSKTCFSCVRFGNVLGSRGSVVGIFRDQIAKGGPVTVTHPEARRYFMTIPEAANLVIQAGTIGDDGEVFLLDMGEPVKIIDLARQMIHLCGFSEKEVPIQIVGTRPGEKLFEELSTSAESIARTELRKIFRCKPSPVNRAQLAQLLDRVDFSMRAKDAEGIRQAMKELDIGYVATPAQDA
jgi:FlaA1/EpsC-like NDP-sugar epimerase